MSMKPPSRTALLVTVAALGALFGSSWALSYVHLGRWAAPIALGIATAKSVLIITVFMRVQQQPVANRVVLVTALVLILTLIGFVALDTIRR
jgi:caa(3)-type oxidase subunit IV